MNSIQILVTILIASAVTILTRALPFWVFSGGRKPPAFITWLGAQLPRAVMLMLVVYCLRDVRFDGAQQWLPAFCGVAAAVLLHVWKRRMILSIAGATAVYMALIRVIV
ncbi:MAG: AzlD domain-containing protein [Clostridia bacterium]|nr:AzlD domain-containing protein [Clostridia bacterium]